jgi:hypothetical protein
VGSLWPLIGSFTSAVGVLLAFVVLGLPTSPKLSVFVSVRILIVGALFVFNRISLDLEVGLLELNSLPVLKVILSRLLCPSRPFVLIL